MKDISIVSVDGQTAVLELLGDVVRVSGTIQHGEVFTREEAIRLAKALLKELETDASTDSL